MFLASAVEVSLEQPSSEIVPIKGPQLDDAELLRRLFHCLGVGGGVLYRECLRSNPEGSGAEVVILLITLVEEGQSGELAGQI